MKMKFCLTFKKYFFTNSSLIFLSSFPLMICSLGLFGLMNQGLRDISLQSQMILGLACLLPSFLILFVLARLERKHEEKKRLKKERKKQARNYKNTAPFNNGEGILSDAKYKTQQQIYREMFEQHQQTLKENRTQQVFPGLEIPEGVNPFRPITDQSIDETLDQLAKAKEKHHKGAA